MKNHENSTPGSSERYSVEGLWFDPELREFLSGPVAEAQARIDAGEDPEMVLEKLNDAWYEYDLSWENNGRATISGILRELDLFGGEVEEPRKVDNFEVILGNFDIQYRDGEPVESPRIGFSVFPVEYNPDANDAFLIFPDETSSVELEKPSVSAIETRMHYIDGSGELLNQIHSALDNLNGDTAKTLEQLKTLRFSAAEFPEAAKFFHEVGLVAYSCCDFGEREYDAEISGEVYSYSEGDNFANETLPEPIKITAPICGVQFLPNEDGNRKPALVFAIKNIDDDDIESWVPCIVPVENIENLKRYKPQILKSLGNAALLFAGPEDMAEHPFGRAQEMRNDAQETQNKPDEDPLGLIADLEDEIPEQTYDPERRVFFVAASSDLRTLQEYLSDYLETLRILGTGTGFSDEDLEKIEKFLNEKDVPHLERLTLGGRVRVRGENLSLTPLDGNVNLDLSDDFALEGTFDGVKIGASERDRENLRRKARKTPVKSEKSPSLPKNASKIPEALGFSIILKDCQIPGEDETFDAILHCAPGHFPKLEAIEPASH